MFDIYLIKTDENYNYLSHHKNGIRWYIMSSHVSSCLVMLGHIVSCFILSCYFLCNTMSYISNLLCMNFDEIECTFILDAL